MNVQEQIKEYIATQPEPKRGDMQELHRIILELMPEPFVPQCVRQ
jgi:hypothetical protein